MFKHIFHILLLILVLTGMPQVMAFAQVKDAGTIRAMISRYKLDPRGPYLDIRWFCPDGTIRAARDPCPVGPGHQHARYKEEVNALAKREHVFLGQILTNTPFADFWDEGMAQSRLKQYQVEQYLRGIDNGWINRRAQFYRGAMQTEDENNWGIDFYLWLLEDTNLIHSQYFLIRQSALDIPHSADNSNAQLVRSLTKVISDSFPAFLELRVKIHGLPDEGDIKRVRDFREKNRAGIPASLLPKFDQLLREMTSMYKPFNVSDFDSYRKRLPKESEAAKTMGAFMSRYPGLTSPSDRCQLISRTALTIRKELTSPMKGLARLALIDISVKLEGLLNMEISKWNAFTLKELLSKVYCLSEAAAAFGYVEQWEWKQIQAEMTVPQTNFVSLQYMSEYSDHGRQVVEWGTGMIRAQYEDVINLYRDFEPLATGFYDDRVRASVLLPLGLAVSQLGESFSRQAGFSNDVLAIPGQSSIRGLNAGYAKGKLIVVTEAPEKVVLSPENIYVFHYPPDNLKPVAGIATVTEGNMVSHVQLLARNLGIPNAVISRENMEALKAFDGMEVFYAVSDKGTVIMKHVLSMAPWEHELFARKKQREEKVTIPIDRLVLDDPHIQNLRQVNASHSGKICGPKAANLGQLKFMFPDQVVEGLVLPFAIFRQHMDQYLPGRKTTYWTMMNGVFDAADGMRVRGEPEPEIEAFMLKGLDSLRGLIKNIPLLPAFKAELGQQFQSAFGHPLGKVPVFVRSDTNMEDLKEFTGAGLNLTVFNVLDAEKIYQGIRDVWASPYTERSFTWRQRYMNNPEHVFPSILIIPSVDADISGVVITKGLTSGRDEDITVAFNRGVGGAVDGQAAESWLLRRDGVDQLITPAREPSFLAIPATGGSKRVSTTFEKRILSMDNLIALRSLVSRIRRELPGTPGINSEGPFDIELGFKDNAMWLFQVRPFVENKQAATSAYLQHITPEFDGNRSIPIDLKR